MSEMDAAPVSISQLYAKDLKMFRIPTYQRSYAWEKKQRNDLWDDIVEGIENETKHYLGTIILQETGNIKRDEIGQEYNEYEVVDGQQRLTSLSILLLAIYNKVGDRKVEEKIFENFIGVGDSPERITLSANNNDFYKILEKAVIKGKQKPEANSITNKRIEKTYDFFRDKLEVMGENFIKRISRYIWNEMNILELKTKDKTLAIKTFQTVNDRGKDLTLLDKTKSFLMFYLTKFDVKKDDGKTMEKIEKKFGEIFAAYDRVKELGNSNNISYITEKRQKFTEDNFLQFFYHYFMKYAKREYEVESVEYEYNISAENVFQRFIKNSCIELKESPQELRRFIDDVVENIRLVGKSLVRILERIQEEVGMDKLMRWQQPNALIYPLIIGAEAEGILDEDMVELIRVLDMRVYKIRNTDPRAKLYKRAVAEIKNQQKNKEDTKQQMLSFLRSWGRNEELESYLQGNIYARGNRGEKIALWQYAKKYSEDQAEDYEFYNNLEIEHVLADDAKLELDLRDCGFLDEEEFNAYEDRFGNLMVLESELNKSASNKPPIVKAGEEYQKSKVKAIRLLGNTIINDKGFNKESVNKRTKEIVETIKEEWPIMEEE